MHLEQNGPGVLTSGPQRCRTSGPWQINRLDSPGPGAPHGLSPRTHLEAPNNDLGQGGEAVGGAGGVGHLSCTQLWLVGLARLPFRPAVVAPDHSVGGLVVKVVHTDHVDGDLPQHVL